MKVNKISALLSDRSEEEHDSDLENTKREMNLLLKEAAALFVLLDCSQTKHDQSQADETKNKILQVYTRLTDLIFNSQLPNHIKDELRKEFQTESIKYVNDLGKNDNDYSIFLEKHAGSLILPVKKKLSIAKFVFLGMLSLSIGLTIKIAYDFKIMKFLS